MSQNISPTALILIAVMNDPRDLEIARLLGWYRIPLRSAPKVISVDYLAFYQTAAFGEDRWRIQYIAPVLGHELSTRIELLRDEPDHPHAHREYYKIQVGPLLTLANPILAENWRRITFLYTTGERLLQACTIQDVIISGDERPLLWQALRERASQTLSVAAYQPELPGLDLDPELLSMLLGIREAEQIYSHTDQIDLDAFS